MDQIVQTYRGSVLFCLWCCRRHWLSFVFGYLWSPLFMQTIAQIQEGGVDHWVAKIFKYKFCPSVEDKQGCRTLSTASLSGG